MKKPLPKLIALILLTALIVAVFCPFKTVFSYGENSAADVDERFVALGSETIIDKIGKAIFKGKTIVGEVYLGGIPIGISLESSGVKVIGISEIITGNGVQCPAIEADIRIGDLIVSINGEEINSSVKLGRIVSESEGNEVELEIIRGERIKKKIKPQYDVMSGRYKLGLWTKEGSSGIGTLTFVKEDGKFASLGHPIVNPETGEIYKISGGTVYKCAITGVIKGVRGRAGELRGDFRDEKLGSVSHNGKIGVFGTFTDESYRSYPKIKILSSKSVKPGKAYVYTTVDGETPELYEAEIIKAASQSGESDKGVVIRITDKRLLEKTGGIVQGMSGSPIIQEGCLVGAVTHVFVSDGTKGYGVYAEFMCDKAK